jgi:hypothetical protein
MSKNNGAVATPTAKNETGAKVETPILTVVKSPAMAEQKSQPQSIADIMRKIERLNELNEQRENAEFTVQKLKGFNPELTEAKTQVVIKDARGKEFTTSNTEALKLVISHFLKYSENRLQDIEAELMKAA